MNGPNLLTLNMLSTSKHMATVSSSTSNLIAMRVLFSTNLLFMGSVAMVFAPLAPLVCFAGAFVFWISSWVYKYQLMFVFTTKVESGGVSFFCDLVVLCN